MKASHATFHRLSRTTRLRLGKELAYLGIGSANSGSHGDKSDEVIREDPLKDKAKILVDWEERKGGCSSRRKGKGLM